MNVTYEIDSQSSSNNSFEYSDYLQYFITNKPLPGKHKKPHKHNCDKGCDCHKNTKKELEKLKAEVIKEVMSKIIDKDVDIHKIVNAVIQKTKAHEDRQTSNIKKNKQDIIDLNSITIWDKKTNF